MITGLFSRFKQSLGIGTGFAVLDIAQFQKRQQQELEAFEQFNYPKYVAIGDLTQEQLDSLTDDYIVPQTDSDSFYFGVQLQDNEERVSDKRWFFSRNGILGDTIELGNVIARNPNDDYVFVGYKLDEEGDAIKGSEKVIMTFKGDPGKPVREIYDKAWAEIARHLYAD